MGWTNHAVPLAQSLSEEESRTIEALAHDLKALGIRVALPDPLAGGLLVFEYDLEAHKRNAGRKRKEPPSGSTLEIMTQQQRDVWLLNASIETVKEELGVSRSTAFRRRAEARERLSYAIVPLDDSINS